MHPIISVVLVTYNHEKYVAEAVQSILGQTFDNFELIIINDGSTDETEKVIKSFNDARIKYVYQHNQGPSAAINAGTELACGKYVMFMSGDDVSHPERMEKQYK